jgi:hypothetical protein
MLVTTRLLLLNSGSDGNAATPPRERGHPRFSRAHPVELDAVSWGYV